MFDKLNDINLRLEGRNEVLGKCIEATKVLGLHPYGTNMFHYHITDMQEDIRALAEGMKPVHRENARIDILSVPTVNEHVPCMLREKNTFALETWLDKVDNIMLTVCPEQKVRTCVNSVFVA